MYTKFLVTYKQIFMSMAKGVDTVHKILKTGLFNKIYGRYIYNLK